MTQAQFNKEYKNIYPQWYVMTTTDRRLYYNDLMESYYNNGSITARQRQNWGHPKFIETRKNQIDCNKY